MKGVNRPKRFNVLIVPSDGSAPFRFRLPRWSVYAALTAVALAVASLSAVVGDYLRVRHLNRDTLALHGELAEQQSLIDALHRRVGEIRLEVATWRDLHAKIWEPFGPDAGPGRNTRGIGGAQPPATEPPPGPRPSALEELDRLAETVSEEGQSLRALERLMARAGRALALLPSRWPVRGGVNSEFGSRSSPWTQGTEFLGEAMLLAGISFLLGTILAGLREGGGEVQESLGLAVKTLRMPTSAKLFLVLMFSGFMLGVAQFVLYGIAAYVDDPATWFAWLGPLRELSLGILLSGIVLALFTIGTVLGFQHWRIRQIIETGR